VICQATVTPAITTIQTMTERDVARSTHQPLSGAPRHFI